MTPVTEHLVEHAPVTITETDVLDDTLADADVSELRQLLVEQRRVLADHTRMLDAIDRRREELEELVEVMLPIANGALLLASRRLDTLERSGVKQTAIAAKDSVLAALDAPAPGLRQLWKRARTPEARKGLAVLVESLRVLGGVKGVQQGESVRSA